jgi:hypothetical protein
MASQAPLIHDTPFPLPVRIVLCVVGAFFFVIAPYELWRGVWPPSLLTPFFGLLMFAGMSGGGVAMFTGLFSPHQTLVFRHGVLEVREAFPGRTRERRFALSEILVIEVTFHPDSEGPDTWRATIRTKGGLVFTSRPFDTEATAQRHAAEFRAALGM